MGRGRRESRPRPSFVGDAMPIPTRPYIIPGFRIALVREPGVKLAERPELRSAAEAVPILAQFIGETDREVFAIALLTVRRRQ